VAETPEAGVKRQVRAVLDAHELKYWQNTTSGYGRSGALDFTVNAWGYLLVVEAKSVESPYGKRGPTALQWQEIDAVMEGMGVALVIDENTMPALQDVLVYLRAGATHGARRKAWRNHQHYPRVQAEPDTDNPPTKRKPHVRHL